MIKRKLIASVIRTVLVTLILFVAKPVAAQTVYSFPWSDPETITVPNTTIELNVQFAMICTNHYEDHNMGIAYGIAEFPVIVTYKTGGVGIYPYPIDLDVTVHNLFLGHSYKNETFTITWTGTSISYFDWHYQDNMWTPEFDITWDSHGIFTVETTL